MAFRPCIINLNARSLNTEKIDELQIIASNVNVSIICVTETWLKDYIADESVSINGFIVKGGRGSIGEPEVLHVMCDSVGSIRMIERNPFRHRRFYCD